MKRLSMLAFFLPILAIADDPPKKPSTPAHATAPDKIKIKDGFRVELLYSVPLDEQGSWVSMCVEPKGRLYVSDQYGGLFRITPPPVGKSDPIKVEKVPVDVGEAQGMVWANDSLYVVVNHAKKFKSGLYRVTDTDGDDQLDEVNLLRHFDGDGEHGPHAVVLGPDKKSLYLVIGNHTKLTKIDSSRVPQCWGEDHIVPRMWDAKGHAVGIVAPGGHILKTDLDGKKWELFSIGYRNCYDAAFNRDGELFTYDSDMEWDINTPWYRPTRVCHVTSGSDFGWRSGSGNYPTYYAETLPPVVNIGPGSPTGVTFGYGAKFPSKYQDALFLCDWSYGKLYALHLKPQGASYTGEFEEFLSGTPLPLTDIVISPVDGALYFTIGGRKTTSGLYRVTYVGIQSSGFEADFTSYGPQWMIRHELDKHHLEPNPNRVNGSWDHLGSTDRFLRLATRINLEKTEPNIWEKRALEEPNPQTALTALLALTRVGDKKLQPDIIQALGKIDWKKLDDAQRLDLIRVYELAFLRMGRPSKTTTAGVLQRFEPMLPSANRELNSEIGKLLAYLESPTVVPKLMKSLAHAPSQEEQMDYVNTLRTVHAGWTRELREQYFAWFQKAAGYRGGQSFAGFVKMIQQDAIATLTDDEWEQLGPLLKTHNAPTPTAPKARAFVKKWTMADLTPIIEGELKGRDFNRGQELFSSTRCVACHRFQDEGGVGGPDLTGAAGRLSVRDLLESIVEPSKVISDQYAATVFMTANGKLVTGRIVNLNEDILHVGTDLYDPNAITRLKRNDIESMELSKISMMPDGLIDTCTEDEIKDLLAYILSKGDRNPAMFKK